MTQKPTTRSLSITLVSAFVLILNAALYCMAFFVHGPMLLVAIILTAVVLICYLAWTPVSYELSADELIVHFRIGRVRYGPILKCSTLETRLTGAIGLFRNGGLFAVSGIFWNRALGTFRAYVTTSKPTAMLLIQTPRHKIIISPENPQAFLTATSSGA